MITANWEQVATCPICRKRRWCRIRGDGSAVLCRREEYGAAKTVKCKDGTGWLHVLDGRQPVRPVTASPRRSAPRTPDGQLNHVYRRLLAAHELSLTRQHRHQLLARGLTQPDIDSAGYRSLPAACRAGIVRTVRENFTDELLLTVPGIIARDGPHGRYLTVAGLPGLLIPVRSAGGHIVGIVVRPDDPGAAGKYLWLSSTRHGGPGPGARVHVPAGTKASGRVIVTEGTLKADVAHALSGRAIIGMPGPHVSDDVIATAKVLGATEVLLALDADTRTNQHVAHAQLEGLRRLNAAGFREGLLKWEPTLGKGLDDALLSWRGTR